MIESLVMDAGRVQALKALATSFARIDQNGETMGREAWAADFVKGKGNGLIFLLHGRPGVGKTCTAGMKFHVHPGAFMASVSVSLPGPECISEYTGRPLMVLASSDIGTDPLNVEVNLTKSFKTARSWGAVLLIDEADVFMERRSTSDLVRNSLVAGTLIQDIQCLTLHHRIFLTFRAVRIPPCPRILRRYSLPHDEPCGLFR